jgi:hypothetical protein
MKLRKLVAAICRDHRHRLIAARFLGASAAAEEIECRVMSDAKEPAFRPLDRRAGSWVVGCPRLDRFGQRILHDIFAIDYRSGHPRAIAMELRPQLAHQAFEVGAGFIACWRTLQRLGHCASNLLVIEEKHLELRRVRCEVMAIRGADAAGLARESGLYRGHAVEGQDRDHVGFAAGKRFDRAAADLIFTDAGQLLSERDMHLEIMLVESGGVHRRLVGHEHTGHGLSPRKGRIAL